MFNWLFAKKPERTSKNGETLTEWERTSIAKSFDKGKAKCPDCKGDLIKGPEGGAATNVCCAVCHSEYNLTFWYGACIGERISDAGPRDVGDRGRLYGLKDKECTKS